MGVVPRIPPLQLGLARVLPLLVNQDHAYGYKLTLPPSPKLVRSLCFDHANVGPA